MYDIFHRPHTFDANIWLSVFDGNEYGLPAAFPEGAVVLDIGAHIGAFTYTALNRGAAFVLAIEPAPENARLWQHNLHRVCRATDRAVLVTAAAWHEGGSLPLCLFDCLTGAPIGPNTGGSNVVRPAGHPVRTVPFDALVDMALSASGGERIALLKLDCEGSEWPILFASKRLHLIDEIVGEYHLTAETIWPGARTVADLIPHLAAAGFMTAFQTDDARLGKFHAWRSTPLCNPIKHAHFAGWEPWLAHTIPAGRLALDIGANHGAWSRELLTRFDRVIAFEPQSELAVQLRSVPRLEVREVGLWHEAGVLTLHHNGHDGQTSCLPIEGQSRTSDAQAVTLDSLGLAPDFLKIDAEGAELHILRGGEQTIRKHRPCMLVECHNHIVAGIERACRELLSKWDYDPVHIDNPITPHASTWLWCRH
jgi:FkbM family methyltransferase